MNAAKAAREKIRKQQAALSAKAFGVINGVIKTNVTKNSNNKNVKNSKMSSSTPPVAKTTPSEKTKFSFSSPPSSTSPPTSLYNMKFTQIWTKKRLEQTTTMKTKLKKKENEEDKSDTETMIDPKSWEDIDVLVPFTQKNGVCLLNSPSTQTNKKHQKTTTTTTTTTLLPKTQSKQNNKTKTNVVRHSGQTVMKQLETPKRRVEITLESTKHSFNNQTILPFSSFSSVNLTKNHFHLAAAKTIKTTKNSKELTKKSSKILIKNQKINNLPNKLISSREELEHLRHALIKNLEKFLKNKRKEEMKESNKQKRFIEPPKILFYSKEVN
ncbi:unnamed protein product [Meloidogyne enterolobii]|uniref:Uncharacterized protein n=1 Tax=Meloidogyne enterolobii TaxID=390850 RepID=A0ACB0Z8K9_MELEN